MNGSPGEPPPEFDDPHELPDEDLLFAQRAWDDASREYREQQDRRDRALNQLSTTRTVSWAMATVLGGAVVLAGDPLSTASSAAGVQICLGITAMLLATTIVLSVIPNFWPGWAEAPGHEDLVGMEVKLTYIAALWKMAELAATASQRNSKANSRLEQLVNTASAGSALSALGLVSAAILVVLALQ